MIFNHTSQIGYFVNKIVSYLQRIWHETNLTEITTRVTIVGGIIIIITLLIVIPTNNFFAKEINKVQYDLIADFIESCPVKDKVTVALEDGMISRSEYKKIQDICHDHLEVVRMNHSKTKLKQIINNTGDI